MATDHCAPGNCAACSHHRDLIGFNQSWAGSAAALVAFVTEHTNADGKPQPTASYDTGQAAAYFTIQAQSHGLFSHQMSEFDADALAAAFEVESRFTPTTVMAIGTIGDPFATPEHLHERETAPRARRVAAESVLLNA